jgi:hypothetical protein
MWVQDIALLNVIALLSHNTIVYINTHKVVSTNFA